MNLVELPGGDMFASGASALVNPVNTEGVMGKGLALEFKRRFPEAAAEYVKACEEKRLEVGNVLLCAKQSPAIIHFPTKIKWRNPSKLHYIDSTLLMLWSILQSGDYPSVAIPALGCGLGGLPWPEVRNLIVWYLEKLDITVYLYPPREGK